MVRRAAQGYHAPVRAGPFSLLVFGGSQGARFFSDILPPALALLPPELRASLFVVQQCREEDLARVEEAYKESGVRAHLATFFANLPEEMAKCHLVIGRAGASTVAELAVMGRPAILVCPNDYGCYWEVSSPPTALNPLGNAAHADSTSMRRKRQMPRACSRAWLTTTFMTSPALYPLDRGARL